MCNMGNCMRCCCLMLPISWTLSTFVLVIWILVGNTSTAPFPVDTYFLRMNVSNIDPIVTPAAGMTIAETIGLHDFYQTGLWNYCEGYYIVSQNWDDVVTSCGDQVQGYSFDPISLMGAELLYGYSIVFVQNEVNAIQTLRSASGWLKASFVITALFTGFTLLIGPLTGVWHKRRAFNCIPVGTMCVAALFVFMGAVTATSVYFQLRDAFNNDTRLHVQAHMGHQMFAWVWLCVWCAWTAATQWCCAAICCPGGHRKHRVDWRRPFPGIAGLVPIPWIGSKVKPNRPTSQVPIVSQPGPSGSYDVPIVNMPANPQPPVDAEHHSHAGAVAAGLGGALVGAALAHHHHQENQPPEPPPPPEHHHHVGPLAAGAVGAATGLAIAHHEHQHQSQPPAPPPPEHHHHVGPLAAGAVGAATGLAIAHHEHQHQSQPPAPPPPGYHHHGCPLAAGAVGAATGLAVAHHEQHQTSPPQPEIPPPIPIVQNIPLAHLPPPPVEIIQQPRPSNVLATGDILEVGPAPAPGGGALVVQSNLNVTESILSGSHGAAALGLAAGAGLNGRTNALPQPEPPLPPPPAVTVPARPIQAAPMLPEPVVIDPRPIPPPPAGHLAPVPVADQQIIPAVQVPQRPQDAPVTQPLPGPMVPVVGAGVTTAGQRPANLADVFPYGVPSNGAMVHESLDQLFPQNPHR